MFIIINILITIVFLLLIFKVMNQNNDILDEKILGSSTKDYYVTHSNYSGYLSVIVIVLPKKDENDTNNTILCKAGMVKWNEDNFEPKVVEGKICPEVGGNNHPKLRKFIKKLIIPTSTDTKASVEGEGEGEGEGMPYFTHYCFVDNWLAFREALLHFIWMKALVDDGFDCYNFSDESVDENDLENKIRNYEKYGTNMTTRIWGSIHDYKSECVICRNIPDEEVIESFQKIVRIMKGALTYAAILTNTKNLYSHLYHSAGKDLSNTFLRAITARAVGSEKYKNDPKYSGFVALQKNSGERLECNRKSSVELQHAWNKIKTN